MMEIEQYLRFVAGKVEEARKKSDLKEVERLLVLCAETCLDKASEVSAHVETGSGKD